MRRSLLRLRATDNAATSVVPGTPMEKPLRITPKMRGAKIHANMPAEAGRDRKAVMELLLTQLGVRAPHVLRTFRHRLHRQKRWHELSCS